MADLTLAEIEETKLLANAFDRASTGCLTIGVATPLAGYIYNLSAFGTISLSQMALNLLGWFLIALLLHYMARRILRTLR